MRAKMKPKKCRICRQEFNPQKTTQIVCSYLCAIEHAQKEKRKNRRKEAREWREEKRIRQEELRTRSYYVRQLQALVNKYVRTRDNGKKCISCEEIVDSRVKKFDAGHYFSAGHYPELRFNLDNIHGQCVQCNRSKGGNLIEYRPNLIQRIGKERFEQLERDKNKRSELGKYDLKELICDFKKQLKSLENDIQRNQ